MSGDDRRVWADGRRVWADGRRVWADDRRMWAVDRRLWVDDRRLCADDRRVWAWCAGYRSRYVCRFGLESSGPFRSEAVAFLVGRDVDFRSAKVGIAEVRIFVEALEVFRIQFTAWVVA